MPRWTTPSGVPVTLTHLAQVQNSSSIWFQLDTETGEVWWPREPFYWYPNEDCQGNRHYTALPPLTAFESPHGAMLWRDQYSAPGECAGSRRDPVAGTPCETLPTDECVLIMEDIVALVGEIPNDVPGPLHLSVQ